MQKFVVIVIMLLVSSCSAPTKVATELPDSSELPRMPDEYRDKDKRITDPVGMWVYDAAEKQAEDDYFGVEVLSLEESQRILRDRKEAQKNESSSAEKESK
ncbi:MAG: hypothetical protein KKD01_07135 [Proteobacteria bacterium]|nr:hypothetical protein [Pseudomonadota bacterium]MBU1419972.1 hypothetical protein [Pseudomonadota bacterium]MBU1454488.1 hypothetical protein [Pseudomonadota bacterium]